MSSLWKFPIEEAQEAFTRLEESLDDFIRSRNLEFLKWYHDDSKILIGTNLTDPNFYGIRRQISIYPNPKSKELYITASAYSDTSLDPRGRKLKNAYMSRHPIDISPEQFNYYLDIAWRVANSVVEEELLEIEKWQKDLKRKQTLLFGRLIFE